MADLIERIPEGFTPGPWKWWTSNSWRRLKRDDWGISQSVAEPYVCRDGHPDLTISQEDMALIAIAPENAGLVVRTGKLWAQHRWLATILGRTVAAALREAEKP